MHRSMMKISLVMTTSLALLAGSALGCSASEPDGGDIESDDSNEVKAVAAPLGTYAVKQEIGGFAIEMKVAFRSDNRFFATLGMACDGKCTEQQELVATFAFGNDPTSSWGTFELTQKEGKSFIEYKLAKDSERMIGFTDEPDEVVIERDAITILGPSGGKLVRVDETVCHEVDDCTFQSKSKSEKGAFACTENVCVASAASK